MHYSYRRAIERVFSHETALVNQVGRTQFSSEALADRRRRLHLSQEDLARRSGVATVTVQKLEEGRIRDPRGSTLAKLAAVLGCRVESLLGSVRQKPSKERP